VTKSVLLFGALAVVALLSMWLLLDFLPFAVGPTGNQSIDNELSALRLLSAISRSLGGPWSENPFYGLGPAFRFWLFLLLIAVVMDYFGRHRDRKIVTPFAAAIKPDVLPDDGHIMQASDGALLRTAASGSLDNRDASVTLLDNEGSRTGPVLRVDIACNCPWVFEIRKKSLFAELLGAAGAVVATGDAALDAAVVVQAADDVAVRRWLNKPAVRDSVLSLFEGGKVESVGSLHSAEPGAFLRCEMATRNLGNPFIDPTPDAAKILEPLRALAKSAESK
jgi:hypothetical protein